MTTPPAEPTTPSESTTDTAEVGSPIQGPYLQVASPTVLSTPDSSSVPAVTQAAQVPAVTGDYDDGFSESVPFQALNLRINRSKGVFQLEGDEEVRSEVLLIPRAARTNKQYFGLPYDPKTPHEPSCSSPDGNIGYGWVDAETQAVAARHCATCPRKGYGAGSCDDLKVLFAYDIEKQVPVLVQFKNAECSPRNGVFTMAVNRMRTMGARAVDTVFKVSFVEADGPYSKVAIDVIKGDGIVPDGLLAEVSPMLDAGWMAWREALEFRASEIKELM